MPDWPVDKEEGGVVHQCVCVGGGGGGGLCRHEREREQFKASSDTSMQGS